MMTQRQALEVLARERREQVVITTMSAVAIWPLLSDSPLDFHYIPSAMGHGPDLGLGLALAQPKRGVIVINGDGCMLMNLGCLATIADQRPQNYTLIVFNNGVYEVTGGQPVAGAGRVDFAAMARAAGIRQVSHIRDISSWKGVAAQILRGPGLEFAVVDVEPITTGEVGPKAPCPIQEQLAQFTQALGAK